MNDRMNEMKIKFGKLYLYKSRLKAQIEQIIFCWEIAIVAVEHGTEMSSFWYQNLRVSEISIVTICKDVFWQAASV